MMRIVCFQQVLLSSLQDEVNEFLRKIELTRHECDLIYHQANIDDGRRHTIVIVYDE